MGEGFLIVETQAGVETRIPVTSIKAVSQVATRRVDPKSHLIEHWEGCEVEQRSGTNLGVELDGVSPGSLVLPYM